MTDRPLVSVITGTYNRHDLLQDAIENVRQQTYPNIEHVIVSDGPDCELADLMKTLQIQDMEASIFAGEHGTKPAPSGVPIRFAECGRHWSSFLAASISTVPFQVAQWMARGPYLMWLADDERMTPDHIESLVDLLEATDSDFTYSYARLVPGPGVPITPMIIGSDPPMLGQITNALFRAELLDYRGFTTHVGSATDWDQVRHWMAAGARWAMLDRVTLTHQIDKLGEGPDFKGGRQPLRGHRERVTA